MHERIERSLMYTSSPSLQIPIFQIPQILTKIQMSPPHLTPFTRQILAAILLHHPFTRPPLRPLPTSSLLPVLSSLPSLLFLPPRSLSRQSPFSSRHHPPMGPTPKSRSLALVSIRFYHWAHSSALSPHHPSTLRAMARLLALSRHLSPLWHFLKHHSDLLSTPTLTHLVHTLGLLSLPSHALALFYRFKNLHCVPDLQAYNTTIAALCRSCDFKNARRLLSQMELPGSKCPPDSFTYTILISAYCKHGMHTGCRKAISRRIWEASRMFRQMLFRGLAPDVVTYNCLIDGLCKTYRVERARELFDEMLKKGCLPNRVTYNSFVRYYSVVNEVDKGIGMMREMVARGHGVATCSTYTPVIHSLCEAGRVREAREFLVEMVEGGEVPREYTYQLVCEALRRQGEEGLPKELRRRVEVAMDERRKRVMRLKPVLMRRRDGFVQQEDICEYG